MSDHHVPTWELHTHLSVRALSGLILRQTRIQGVAAWVKLLHEQGRLTSGEQQGAVQIHLQNRAHGLVGPLGDKMGGVNVCPTQIEEVVTIIKNG